MHVAFKLIRCMGVGAKWQGVGKKANHVKVLRIQKRKRERRADLSAETAHMVTFLESYPQ
jgi:hypothetical protein